MKRYRLVHELPCGELVKAYQGTKEQVERWAARIRENLGPDDEGIMYVLRIRSI